MIVSYVNKEVRCPFSLQFFKDVIEKAAQFEKKIAGEVEVVVVGDSRIKALNRRYRKKNKVTDVLSFAWREDKKMPGKMLGQIYICYPQIVRQAKEFKIKIKEELARMLTHGLLHLVGYDHTQIAEEKKMFDLQEKIIKSIL